jgi:hypothetical protein
MATTLKTLTGRVVSLTIGADTVTNCKSIKWKTSHTISPRLLPSSKIPVGWLQSHSWIEGEFNLLSLCSSIQTTHAPAISDAIIISPFIVTGETTDGLAVTYTFDGLIIQSIEKGLEGTEPVFTHKFLAYSVTEAVEEPA